MTERPGMFRSVGEAVAILLPAVIVGGGLILILAFATTAMLSDTDRRPFVGSIPARSAP